MAFYDFTLQDGRDGRFYGRQHVEAADFDTAVRKALEWAEDARGIWGDPIDFSRWTLRVFEGRELGQAAGTHILFEIQDVRPHDWPEPSKGKP